MIKQITVLGLSLLGFLAPFNVKQTAMHQMHLPSTTPAPFTYAVPVRGDDVPSPVTQEIITLNEVVITVPSPKASRKATSKDQKLTCGDFEPLQNDAVQKVKRCAFR